MGTQQEVASRRRTRLQAWMDQYQVTRTELAKRLGVGRAYISLLLIERGEDEKQKTRFFGEKSARSIEVNLGLPAGYLDSNGLVQTPMVEKWETTVQIQDGAYALVPRVSVTLADGGYVDVASNLPPLAFTKVWLDHHGVVERKGLRVVDVQGDSMSEYLQHGDLALIDMGQTHIIDRQVYALKFSDEIRFRRVEKMLDGGVRVMPDNLSYQADTLSPEQAKALVVLGRCIWRAG